MVVRTLSVYIHIDIYLYTHIDRYIYSYTHTYVSICKTEVVTGFQSYSIMTSLMGNAGIVS